MKLLSYTITNLDILALVILLALVISLFYAISFTDTFSDKEDEDDYDN